MFGYSGDNVPATSAALYYPGGLSRDAAGNIFIADIDDSIIREVNTSGIITTVAGTPTIYGYSGDGGLATSRASLSSPTDVFINSFGNMFIADSENGVIREVVCATTGTLSCTSPQGETAGYIYTVAGNFYRSGTYFGDGGPATSAGLSFPASAAVTGAGNLYIADEDNCRIREVNAVTGIISTIAGDSDCTFTGDGRAVDNSLGFPGGVRVDANGNVFISDLQQRRGSLGGWRRHTDHVGRNTAGQRLFGRRRSGHHRRVVVSRGLVRGCVGKYLPSLMGRIIASERSTPSRRSAVPPAASISRPRTSAPRAHRLT